MIGIKILRTKIIAILLGPTGVGIAGLFGSTLDIVRNATSLGLDFSAVKDVAEANSSGDQERISRTITILRRWMWITGLLGVSIIFFFRKQLSFYTFKDESHSIDFILLSIVPLLTAITGGQFALLRGVRRIGDMVRADVIGAAAGFMISIPLYWLWGVDGIVPAIVLTGIVDLILSWIYSGRLKIPSVKVSFRETYSGGKNMIRLGFFTVIASLAMSSALYLIRLIIVDKVGLDGVGQFQAAWNLSATYVGLVLGAMGADYYPRLVSVNHDNSMICKLVNEQTEIAILLAAPLIIGMIGFVDIVVSVFYTEQFGFTSQILLWQLLGEFFKVISWPMGFVLLAKNKGLMFIIGDLIWDFLLLSIIWFFLDQVGIEITGIAFFIGYIVYLCIVFFLSNKVCNFKWTTRNVFNITFFAFLAGLVFINTKVRFTSYYRITNIVILFISIYYSLYELSKVVDFRQLINRFKKKFCINGNKKD